MGPLDPGEQRVGQSQSTRRQGRIAADAVFRAAIDYRRDFDAELLKAGRDAVGAVAVGSEKRAITGGGRPSFA